MPMVCLGQNSKPVGTIIIPAVVTDNQPVPDLTRDANCRKFSVNGADLSLEGDQVKANIILSIVPMTVRALEVGGDYYLWDSKNIVRELPITNLPENKFGSQSVLRPVHTAHDNMCRISSGESCLEKKIFWMILPVIPAHAHSNLSL